MNTFHITHGGLKPKTEDGRDFPLGGVYGHIDIKDVPNTDFIVVRPFAIKDQGDSDLCSSFAVTSVSEDQEGVELSPEYQFFCTKRITGEPEEWGADLRSACKSAVKYGSVAANDFPEMKGRPRDYILDSKNWRYGADMMARRYKKETYFEVTGNRQYDLFDKIRCALWQHKEDRSTIVTGACWRTAWITAPNAIIKPDDGDGFGHAFKIFGQKVINGELYLVAQLSNGVEVGDQGLYYFSREVANKELGEYGLYMFKDMPREEAEDYLSKPYIVSTPWYQRIFLLITNLFKKS